MYEQFRGELMAQLAALNAEIIGIILNAVDRVASNYDIKRKETQLIVYGSEMPEMVKSYLVARAIEGVSQKTLKGYQQLLQNFFKTVSKPVDKLTANDLRVWLYQYETLRKVSKRTLDHYRVVLNSFFAWAATEGWLAANPMSTIKPIKHVAKQKSAMGQMELEYIRQACITTQELAVVEVLYSTGCRVSELSALKKGDIDWERREVLLFGKGSKYRTGYLNAKSIVALRNYLATRNDNDEHLIVSTRAPHHMIGKGGLERIINKIVERVRDKLGVHVTPHVFRHTTATQALQSGMPVQDVQKMLGHVNINTTMVYAQTSQSEVKNMHEKFVV